MTHTKGHFEYQYDSTTDRITLTARNYPYDEKSSRAHKSLVISVTEYGLMAKTQNLWRNETYYFPGEYSAEEISQYLALKFLNVGPREPWGKRPAWRFICDLLLETEMWDRRGLLGNPRSFPAELIAKMPLKAFAEVGVKSYRKWLEAAFFKHDAFHGMSKERLAKMVARNAFPARVHSIRGWQKLSYNELAQTLRHEGWSHPSWALFISQCYDLHKRTLQHHTEAWQEISVFIQAAIKFPKTARVADLFYDIYNANGSLARVLEFRNIRDLETYLAVVREQRETQVMRSGRLRGYKPPALTLPEGWLWATEMSFWGLGTLYNCCVSSSAYSTPLSDGSGAIAYRPDFDKKDDAGALCFFHRGEGNVWTITEIRGWCNSSVDPLYREQAQAVAHAMSESPLQVRKMRAKHKRALRERNRGIFAA